MRGKTLRLAGELAEKGEPFVLAVVVRREPASSSRAGDSALITHQGEFHGWLGGSCVQPTVVAEALAALRDGRPRLLVLAPHPERAARPGVLVFPMNCQSGGTVEVYLEPVLPAPRLLLFGTSPVNVALIRLGQAMGYHVTLIDPDAGREAYAAADERIVDAGELGTGRPAAGGVPVLAVVATMGRRDEEATRAALACEPDYLGVVASRRRFEEIRSALAAGGIPAQTLATLRSPAGLDIGARSPEEIGVSVLAEFVQLRRAAEAEAEADGAPESGAEGEARDPVCGMSVAIATAEHVAEHAGRRYYFCCGGCRERFLAHPESYGEGGGELRAPAH